TVVFLLRHTGRGVRVPERRLDQVSFAATAGATSAGRGAGDRQDVAVNSLQSAERGIPIATKSSKVNTGFHLFLRGSRADSQFDRDPSLRSGFQKQLRSGFQKQTPLRLRSNLPRVLQKKLRPGCEP